MENELLQPQFWIRRLEDDSLISTVKLYPKEAAKFFGALPSLRANEKELRMILAARQILASSANTSLDFNLNQILDAEFHSLFRSLSPDQKSEFWAAVAKSQPAEVIDQWAREIIRDASGE